MSDQQPRADAAAHNGDTPAATNGRVVRRATVVVEGDHDEHDHPHPDTEEDGEPEDDDEEEADDADVLADLPDTTDVCQLS